MSEGDERLTKGPQCIAFVQGQPCHFTTHLGPPMGGVVAGRYLNRGGSTFFFSAAAVLAGFTLVTATPVPPIGVTLGTAAPGTVAWLAPSAPPPRPGRAGQDMRVKTWYAPGPTEAPVPELTPSQAHVVVWRVCRALAKVVLKRVPGGDDGAQPNGDTYRCLRWIATKQQQPAVRVLPPLPRATSPLASPPRKTHATQTTTPCASLRVRPWLGSPWRRTRTARTCHPRTAPSPPAPDLHHPHSRNSKVASSTPSYISTHGEGWEATNTGAAAEIAPTHAWIPPRERRCPPWLGVSCPHAQPGTPPTGGVPPACRETAPLTYPLSGFPPSNTRRERVTVGTAAPLGPSRGASPSTAAAARCPA